MRTMIVGAASAALLSAIAATPASAADVVVYRAPPVYAAPYPYPHYGYHPYHRPYFRSAYVAGTRCWRSAHMRPNGVVVYRRVCA